MNKKIQRRLELRLIDPYIVIMVGIFTLKKLKCPLKTLNVLYAKKMNL